MRELTIGTPKIRSPYTDDNPLVFASSPEPVEPDEEPQTFDQYTEKVLIHLLP